METKDFFEYTIYNITEIQLAYSDIPLENIDLLFDISVEYSAGGEGSVYPRAPSRNRKFQCERRLSCVSRLHEKSWSRYCEGGSLF
jgi:hypothetical protein